MMLCQLYHCTPNELWENDAILMEEHLILQDELTKEEKRKMERETRNLRH
jgi:hypothetical protein